MGSRHARELVDAVPARAARSSGTCRNTGSADRVRRLPECSPLAVSGTAAPRSRCVEADSWLWRGASISSLLDRPARSECAGPGAHGRRSARLPVPGRWSGAHQCERVRGAWG